MEIFELEKPFWDDGDFSKMGWHDVTIWSMLANSDDFEFLIDLDYIFEWVMPKEGETYLKFWVAPATMVFENAHDVNIDITSSQGTIQIADLRREPFLKILNDKFTEHTYHFECQEGEISLVATGFKMVVRRNPELLQRQRFGLVQRQGVSFSRKL
jgi:hypothetical protein